MRVRPQRKNFQCTVISLSIYDTNPREHFHFCIKVRPDSLLSLKYRMSADAADRRNTERETINRLFSAKISIMLKYLLLKVKLRVKSQHAV